MLSYLACIKEQVCVCVGGGGGGGVKVLMASVNSFYMASCMYLVTCMRSWCTNMAALVEVVR